MPSKCHVCTSEATTQCGKCRATWYCNRRHQVEDWKLHKSSCFPLLVQSDKKLGRYLVTSRDIEAGEIIMKEAPMITAPWQMTLPVCLVCTKRVDGSYVCPKCNWPLCGPKCQSSKDHTPECNLTKTKGGVNVKNFDIMHPLYEFVAPLRCLWLRNSDPKRWKEILKMESHSEERKSRGKEEKAKYMKNYLCLDDYQTSEVMHACGVIEVNTFEIPNSNRICLYERASLLAHSCYPNTYRAFNIGEEIVVRASTDISRNQIIYTSYIDTAYGYIERQYFLKSSKYFECECVRCKDATELGTNLSSINCRHCNHGQMPPPLSDSDVWTCHKCGKSEDFDYVIDTLKDLSNMASGAVENISACEKFLASSRKNLSENHYLRLSVKIRLLILYGTEEFNAGKRVSERSINRKRKLCRELLHIADVIMTGYNMFRGLLLSELQNALIWDYQNQKKNKKTRVKRKDIIKELEKILPDILKIYLEDSIVQDERDIVSTTKESFKLVENELLCST